MNKEKLIIDLFRKVISSLACIIKVSGNGDLINEANNYILDFVIQYSKYLQKRKDDNIVFRYSEEDIIDFSYRCINDRYDDLVLFAEDIQFGVIDLMKLIK